MEQQEEIKVFRATERAKNSSVLTTGRLYRAEDSKHIMGDDGGLYKIKELVDKKFVYETTEKRDLKYGDKFFTANRVTNPIGKFIVGSIYNSDEFGEVEDEEGTIHKAEYLIEQKVLRNRRAYKSKEVKESVNLKKPPIGIIPRYLFEENKDKERMQEIIKAISDYTNSGFAVPLEWTEELHERNEKFTASQNKKSR